MRQKRERENSRGCKYNVEVLWGGKAFKTVSLYCDIISNGLIKNHFTLFLLFFIISLYSQNSHGLFSRFLLKWKISFYVYHYFLKQLKSISVTSFSGNIFFPSLNPPFYCSLSADTGTLPINAKNKTFLWTPKAQVEITNHIIFYKKIPPQLLYLTQLTAK